MGGTLACSETLLWRELTTFARALSLPQSLRSASLVGTDKTFQGIISWVLKSFGSIHDARLCERQGWSALSEARRTKRSLFQTTSGTRRVPLVSWGVVWGGVPVLLPTFFIALPNSLTLTAPDFVRFRNVSVDFRTRR